MRETAREDSDCLRWKHVRSRLVRDPIMKDLVNRYGATGIHARPLFPALIRAVVAQQISTKAAKTIRERLRDNTAFVPQKLLELRLDQLKSFGLPARKANTLFEIAKLAIEGAFSDLVTLSDDEVVRRLEGIHGIGKWTGQMFLMFALGRPDVWPLSDGGLRKACEAVYSLRDTAALTTLGNRFRPVRSHAAWYLLRSLENW